MGEGLTDHVTMAKIGGCTGSRHIPSATFSEISHPARARARVPTDGVAESLCVPQACMPQAKLMWCSGQVGARDEDDAMRRRYFAENLATEITETQAWLQELGAAM